MEAKGNGQETDKKERLSYPPPKRSGLMLQGAAAVLFAAAGLIFFYFASREALGLVFVALLLGGLACAAPAIMLVRRVQALRNADYQLDREGLRIIWGVREEHIPMDQIQWVRLEETLEAPLALPRWHWPGAVLGKKKHATWGEMEFLASRGEELVLIGAGKRVFVISPEGRDDFIQGFREMIELGSLKGMKARSIDSAYLMQEIWQSSRAWMLLAISALLNLGGLLVAAWQAPQIDTISLGFTPRGAPLPPVPGVQIFLLPITSLTFFAATFVLAGAAQRRDPSSPYPFILFGANLLASALFITALIIILARN
jgi:hypothetical protein